MTWRNVVDSADELTPEVEVLAREAAEAHQGYCRHRRRAFDHQRYVNLIYRSMTVPLDSPHLLVWPEDEADLDDRPLWLDEPVDDAPPDPGPLIAALVCAPHAPST
jgi:hypothetical protein